LNARRALLMLALLVTGAARAEELMMVRVERGFPETMNSLQQIVRDHGYTVARVQRVDVGLTASGFQTAEYRVVFLGKPDEIERLVARHPTLLPYLPLKITVFAEGESTLALTNNPAILGNFFPVTELRPYFRRWERDVRSILDQLSQER
jgi:uncharacterized protein (DUF302 family)